MKTENKVLMQQAKDSLKGKWGLAIGVFVVFMVIIMGVQMFKHFGPIASLIISGPILLGLMIFTLAIARNQEAHFKQLFEGFEYFWKAMGAYLLMVLFVLLWSLLLIIPGIVAGLRYSMIFFIMADDRNIKPMDALKKSQKIMFGNKKKLFYLELRFIGWILLCILTFGIGFIWLAPYMNVAKAKFYDDIKDKVAQPTAATI